MMLLMIVMIVMMMTMMLAMMMVGEGARDGGVEVAGVAEKIRDEGGVRAMMMVMLLTMVVVMMVVVMMVRMMMMMEVGERAVGGGAGVADTAERDRDEGGCAQ